MVRKIIKYPNLILRKRCSEISEITEEIKRIGQDMKDTIFVSQGIGLAAPQIGFLKRIIVVNFNQKPQIFINPKIIKKSQETIIEEEGCLSFPGLFLKIKRVKKIEIEALKENGEKISLKIEGLPARVFQHEINHLDGILFIDRLSFWQKLKFNFSFG